MSDTLYSAMKFVITGEDHGAAKSVENVGTAGQRAAGMLSGAFSHISGLVGGELGGLVGGVSSMFDDLGNKGASMGEKLGIGGAGLAALGTGLQMLGSKDKEAEAMLSQAITDAGGSIENYRDQINQTIKAQENFGHTAAQTQNALAVLVQITGNTSESIKAMTAVADVAAARHVDLASAARLVGQAMEGQGRLIKLYNIDVQSATKIAQELTKAQKDLATAETAVTTEQEKLSTAQQTLTDDQQKATDAAAAYKMAQDAAAQANQNAATAVATAEQHLSDAQQNEITVQNNLTAARANAAQTLVDLSNKVADATLSQQSAQIAVEEAQQNLAQVMGSASSTQLDKEKAQLAYDIAVQKLKEQTQATAALQAQKAKADAAGVNGAANVVAAETAVRRSHEATAAAVLALSKARENEAMVAERSQLSVARAALANELSQQAVAKAEHNLSDVSKKLAEDQAKLTEAHKNLTAAQDASKDSVDRMNTVIDDLEKHLGGSAAASVDSFAGRLEVLKVKAEDWLSGFGNKWGGLITAIGVGVAVGGPLLSGLFALVTGGAATAGAATDAAAVSIGAAGEAAAASAPEVGAFSLALDSVLLPIAAIALAVVGLAAIFVYLLTHLSDVGKGILSIFVGIGDGWKEMIDGFIGGTEDFIKFLFTLPQDFVDFVYTVVNVLKLMIANFIDGLVNGWNDLTGWIPGLGSAVHVDINSLNQTLGLNASAAPIVSSAQLRSSQQAAAAAHAGNTVNITVNGALDPVGTGRQIDQLLTTYRRQGLGGAPLLSNR